MCCDRWRARVRSAGALFGLALVVLCTPSRADTVASLLGDFTINQYLGVRLSPQAADLHFVVVFGQLPALRELHLADRDGDGVTTQEERDAYVGALAADVAHHLALTLDGREVALRAVRWSSSLPKEQTGFSLRVDLDFAAQWTAAPGDGGAVGARELRISNTNYAGRIGWHEIAVMAQPGVQVYDTDAYGDSMTGALAQALQTLPAGGPLDERSVHLRFTTGALPPGAVRLALRDAPGQAQAAADPGVPATPDWLRVRTRQLIELISAPQVPLHIVAFALLAAMALGALHALSPGHGKSIVGAYLVGSRGTPRHAAFLGLTVTLTHTLVVFVLGLATLGASRFVVPQTLFPLLSLTSGALVLGMGVSLLARRWPAARAAWHGLHRAATHAPDALGQGRESAGHAMTPSQRAWRGHGHALAHGHAHIHALDHGHGHHHGQDHDHGHGHDHNHRHDHETLREHSHANAFARSRAPARALAHTHASAFEDTHAHAWLSAAQHTHGHDAAPMLHRTDPAHVHAHGGTVHSHLPPGAMGEAVTWRGLLSLGVSGGLLPCPSAMVLLLAAVALNKTLLGLLLVLAFSVGLALTLTAIGMVFLYARHRIGVHIGASRWPQLLPALSAVSITVLGAVLCYGSWSTLTF